MDKSRLPTKAATYDRLTDKLRCILDDRNRQMYTVVHKLPYFIVDDNFAILNNFALFSSGNNCTARRDK